MPSIKQYQKSVKRFEKKHHIFAALLIGTAFVLFWRGVWHLADLYLFPHNELLSAVASIAFAFLVLYLRDFDLKELFEGH
jgi:hypothetical protein